MDALPAVPNDVLVRVASIVVRLALTARGTKETLFALSSTAHAGRIVRVVDTAKVASYLTATAGDAGLIDSLMLRVLCAWSILGRRLRLVTLLGRRGRRRSPGTRRTGHGGRLNAPVRGHAGGGDGGSGGSGGRRGVVGIPLSRSISPHLSLSASGLAGAELVGRRRDCCDGFGGDMRIADIDGFDGGYRRRLGGFPATDGTLQLWTYGR